MIPVFLSAALLSGVPDMLGPIGRRSNSEASSQRGREAFVEGRFEDATREFGSAAGIRPGSWASFNLGTARIAAGDVTGGLQALATAFEDESLAADVRYNAGWAALEVRDWDNAIRAYEEVLRERPADANAKRNLEIALKRREEQQQRRQEPDAESESRQPDDEEDGEPEPQARQEPPRANDSDVDSILRSVEQQEKEELERMRRSRRGRKVDW
jgi:Ca-activated chloride channel homolog